MHMLQKIETDSIKLRNNFTFFGYNSAILANVKNESDMAIYSGSGDSPVFCKWTLAHLPIWCVRGGG